MNFLARRAGVCVVQIWLLSGTAFFLLNAVPGDFFSPAALELQASPQALERWREQHGLNLPLSRRYLDWVASSCRGEFGRSLAYEMPVSALLWPRIGKTLQIVIPALLLCWLMGAGLALGAVRGGKRAISVLEFGAVLTSLFPDVIGVSLLLWLAVALGAHVASTLWLPVACLTLILMPTIVLHAANGLAEARALEFVRLAERRGVDETRLWRNYVVPASANPLVSLAGLSLSGAIGTSLLVEVLLGWPGMGSLFVEAAQTRDYPVVASVVTLLGVVLMVSNLVADLVLYWTDPRIRLQHENS